MRALPYFDGQVHCAYYHCQKQCRAVNVSEAVLEGAFADELALLQPTPGYMRLVKDRILHVWEQRRTDPRALSDFVDDGYLLARGAEPSGGSGKADGRCDWLSDWLSK